MSSKLFAEQISKLKIENLSVQKTVENEEMENLLRRRRRKILWKRMGGKLCFLLSWV